MTLLRLSSGVRICFSSLTLLLIPFFALAGDAEQKAREAAEGFLTKLEVNLIFPIITLMLAVAFLLFLFGVFEYIKGAASESERAKGQRHILFGLIGVLVMLSAIAILRIAAGTFGLTVEV